MPSAEKSAASSGIEMTPPQKRGATTRAMGSTAMISIAEICSVAFIRPISAVMAEPARLAESRPAPPRPHPRVLPGPLNQAYLGGNGRAGAARKEQARHDRPELAHERQRHQHAQGLGGAEARERAGALQRGAPA